jgi:hypothetical protein
MDGIDDYRGNEFQWAVDTAIECIEYLLDGHTDPTAQDVVAIAWDFIVQEFSEEGLMPPILADLISAVEQHLQQQKSQN